MKACRDNLLPDGREGAIVPYKGSATWIPMYQGLLKRFRQSGEAKWIGADVVREGEVFEHWVDERGEHFRHVPGDNEKAAIVRVYAAATTKDGGFYLAVMSAGEIEKIRAMSRAGREDSPWQRWTGEMMKKTALRRLSKLLPAGRNMFDDEEESGYLPVESAPQPVAIKPKSAAASLDTFAGTPEPEPEQDVGNMEGEPVDAKQFAWERGKKAKAEGLQVRAIPGEYRNDARAAEAAAWTAGWNGEELADADKPQAST
jgi:recombination protein RecT